ncbi:WG repeat-containing protein [Streptomyces sp. LP05-1]|uniref:WG repeat-containing protein n=1 Tax=Streptomyces pyxinae TaxID=2970734 RepID=A0ABT2CAU8_9ACTN|nr:WG repeat-containing protein [Streptomyces sp. LP05-1]MCS0634535.1 WG repeat-containing protein [Streptomyces sp. LP05-1]
MPPLPVAVEGAAPFGIRFALVDGVGRLVREPDLTAVGAFAGDGPAGPLAPAADTEGRWGYLDRAGRWVAPPVWQYAHPLDDHGRGRFQQGGRWGYIDAAGVPVISARFTETAVFRHGLAVVRTEDGPGWIDPSGAPALSGPYAAVGRFSACGLAGVRLASTGKCGYVDRSGRLVVPARFDGVRPFGPDGLAGARTGELWGLIDRAGAWVEKPRFHRLTAYRAHGLAWFLEAPAGGYREGWLDGRGRVMVDSDGRDVSEAVGCGLIRVRSGSVYGFADTTGASVITPGYAYADDFDACGATLVRDEAQDVPWGVLRPDGTCLPMDHREPLTDREGWPVGFDNGRGTCPFLDHDGSVVRVGPDGREICRVEPAAPDGSALRIRDASGAVVWRGGAAPGTFAPPEPFLAPGREEYTDRPEAWDGDPADLVDGLLAEPARVFLPRSLIFDSEDDVYELSEADAYDLEHHSWFGAMLTPASYYVSEQRWGAFDYLSEWVTEGFHALTDELVAPLTARFGEPEEDRGYLRYGDGSRSWSWRVDGRTVLLQWYWQCGDGDFENQIWLAALDLPEDR